MHSPNSPSRIRSHTCSIIVTLTSTAANLTGDTPSCTKIARQRTQDSYLHEIFLSASNENLILIGYYCRERGSQKEHQNVSIPTTPAAAQWKAQYSHVEQSIRQAVLHEKNSVQQTTLPGSSFPPPPTAAVLRLAALFVGAP